MNDYKFSVAICVYGKDNPHYFKEALESIYSQTLSPDEVILTVDGPVTEDIDNVIETFEQNNGLKVFRLETNQGHGNARRECLSHCTYDIVAIADADDINRKDRFEKQIAQFKKNSDLSAVGSYTPHFVNDIENIISKETVPIDNDAIRKMMKIRCPLTQAAVMFRKSAVEKAGGYLDWYHAEDYYLWLRMYLDGAVFYNIPDDLVYVRTDINQINRRGGYKYFMSLKKLYDFMLKNKVINIWEYIFNVCTRFFLQVCAPSSVRLFIRKHFM